MDKEAIRTEIEDNQWSRFCRLGEMMGDGEHNEPGGKWISQEYKKLSKILIPELKEESTERRKRKAIHINGQMDKLLQTKKCSCGGQLKQGRSGTKIAYCTVCNLRYKATSKNRK